MIFKKIIALKKAISTQLKSTALNCPKLTMSNPNNATNRGAFVVFEGCDRCGKTTQSSLLVEYLKAKNVPVKHMAFPNRESPSGKMINAYLTCKQELPDECIHLLFATNRWEVQNEINKLLKSGTTLVVDRYSYSGVAYSAAKGLSIDWCEAPERGLIRPDMVFFLKTDVDTLASRNNFGEERYEKKEFQKNVQKVFEKIYEAEKYYWTEVNAKEDANIIHQSVASETMKLIEKVAKTPINLLWK